MVSGQESDDLIDNSRQILGEHNVVTVNLKLVGLSLTIGVGESNPGSVISCTTYASGDGWGKNQSRTQREKDVSCQQ